MAAADAPFKAKLEAGLPPACAIPEATTVGYGQAGRDAETILGLVGDDRFRAAYFLGANTLVGL